MRLVVSCRTHFGRGFLWLVLCTVFSHHNTESFLLSQYSQMYSAATLSTHANTKTKIFSAVSSSFPFTLSMDFAMRLTGSIPILLAASEYIVYCRIADLMPILHLTICIGLDAPHSTISSKRTKSGRFSLSQSLSLVYSFIRTRRTLAGTIDRKSNGIWKLHRNFSFP